LGRHSCTQSFPTRRSSDLDVEKEFAVSAAEGVSLKLLATTLATQPAFPPFLSDFATSTFTPADDVRAAQPSPANTLLASRLLIGDRKSTRLNSSHGSISYA